MPVIGKVGYSSRARATMLLMQASASMASPPVSALKPEEGGGLVCSEGTGRQAEEQQHALLALHCLRRKRCS